MAYVRITSCKSMNKSIEYSRRNSRNSLHIPFTPRYFIFTSTPITTRFEGALMKSDDATCCVIITNRVPGYAAHTEYTTGTVIATSPRAENRAISTFLYFDTRSTATPHFHFLP